MDVILTRENFWRRFPNISCLYAESSFYAVADQVEVDLCNIHDICGLPLNLVKADISTQTLVAMSPQVSVFQPSSACDRRILPFSSECIPQLSHFNLLVSTVR